jgi:hypothetical protein
VPVLETFRTSFEPAKGASLSATEQPIDTSTAAGKCFLDMLGVFAEFETNVRGERQLERIGKAKAAGVYSGRRVQGQAGFDRRRSGTRNESPGARGVGTRKGTQDWTDVGLSGTGNRLMRRNHPLEHSAIGLRRRFSDPIHPDHQPEKDCRWR